jgi:hypothetical protein
MALDRWSDKSVESMYDKTFLALETAAIKKHLHGVVCDAGCGEGEGTAEYRKDFRVVAFDSCRERLEMAEARCPGQEFHLHNVLSPFGRQFDSVVSQRLLINMESWEEQKEALLRLRDLTKIGGTLVLSEGSVEGVEELNKVREVFGLAPIPVPEHNVFFSDDMLECYAVELGLSLKDREDFGSYYLLTRGIQPALRDDFHWNSHFNRVSGSEGIKSLLESSRFSRVKVWVFERVEL